MSPTGDAPDPVLRETHAGQDAGPSHDAGPEPPDAGEAGEAGDAADDLGDPGGAVGAEAARRRRRRRRRRRGDPAAAVVEPAHRAEPSGGRPAPPAHGAAPRNQPRRDPHVRGERGERDDRPARPDDAGGRGRARDARSERRTERGEPGRPGPEPRPRGVEPAPAAAQSDAGPERHAVSGAAVDEPGLRFDARRPIAPADDLELEGPAAPAIAWGNDDDGPPPEVVLAADLPDDAPSDDPDPVTYPLVDAASGPAATTVLGDDVASVAGVRYVAGGRVQWCDAGEADYAHGERVVVEADRGTRLAWIAVAPSRRVVRDRGMRRVIRRASDQDLRGERAGDADRAQALRIAKDKAAALRLPLKVFRVELFGQLGRGGRLNVYYTTDERLDLRDFIRELSPAVGARIELRQLGVRDEAKAVGGIGSCGLTLCCTTWLPDFVPVSIKMAKDQGLVLSPTKVSGQCGRLKCCLVYEQAGYAELRKGLPKLGKRVIGARGEARVVEVDVLRQRVRVSYGPGDTEVVAATEVRAMFPSGNPPRARELEPAYRDEPEPGEDAGDEASEDASEDAIDLPGLDDPAEPAAPDPDPDPDLAHGALRDDDAPIPPDDDPSSAP